ncbi:O-antigen ligase family protein [Deinococcus sp.]|uniref:O-antigen ligase family protein n=1 Tax=Deinococcus sp. TaxID=47478 RepID=UPI003CC6899C
MTRAADQPAFIPPKWVSWLIAGVPVFPPLYLAAFASLGLLRTLPLTARWVLFFFASTQLISSLFTPQPLLSLGLNTARTLFILAMISAGVYLRDSRNLRPLLWGELIIFATAWAYTLATQGFAGVQARLGHPYYYIVALGLIAAVALWIIVFWRGGSLWWRVPAGLLSVATFIAAGSRGPLLALVAGSAAAALLRLSRRGAIVIAACLAALVLTATYGPLSTFKPAQRLLTDQTTGREYVWKDAIAAWQSSPIGGVGPYQGGPYLTYLFKDGCQLTPTLTRNKYVCPTWLSRVYGIWLIAHNNVLHWLLETGIVGTLGLLILYFYVLALTVFKKDVFGAAILFGFTAIGMVDVVIAVPDAHFAELWWVVIGMGLLPRGQALTQSTSMRVALAA